MSDEEKAFQAALDADPDDHWTRLVFADWLEDRDDPRAAGYRYLGLSGNVARPDPLDGRYTWYNGDLVVPQICSYLPGFVFRLLEGGRGNKSSHWRDYQSRRAAENAAALAFSRLPAERQAQLLAANAARA